MSEYQVDPIAQFEERFRALVDNVSQVLYGKRQVIELAFTAMIAEGHLLLEDYPGTGKTSLARAMAASIDGDASRIQFTPDLLPGDVTGVSVYDQRKGKFEFIKGPVFANIVLADEINRASPKTQSALLEVMEEEQVTVDGRTWPVNTPFMVIATQNPIEQAGTYRLPEAQLDRFLMKTSLGYPDMASTLRIIEQAGFAEPVLAPVVTTQDISALTAIADQVYVSPPIADYIARIVEATRNAVQVRLGSSVRGAIGLARAAKTRAASQGRNYVTPDDVKELAVAVLAHRLILEPDAEFDGVTEEQVVAQILLDVEPPTEAATA